MSGSSLPVTASNNLRTPVYSLGIGGPNFIDNTDHPASRQLSLTGQEITALKEPIPKAILVISAHWQAPSTTPHKPTLQINTSPNALLIYDFYGFPQRYYEVEYPNRGDPEIAERVAKLLEKRLGKGPGVSVERVERGLDHGVWVGFAAAFNPQSNPLNIPIIQLSLYNNEDPAMHYDLGTALAPLREEGIVIIAAGMAVHNLQDYRRSRGSGEVMPYTPIFDEALKEAATSPPSERKPKLVALLKRDDARKAHPTFEHILPLYVAAGAASEDVGERLWTMHEGPLSWVQYRFGNVA
ncbi:putative aromatic ring-opening dioxygenase LigB subunit [Cadophora sp. DSE1049]|nr:putative aromatic ring-opening dioxygenase LigB subunit [Cadophora sp. DSE1049]